MSNVVYLNRKGEMTVVEALESALDRARAGKIEALAIAEVGSDEIGGLQDARITEAWDNLDRPFTVVALAGALTFLTKHILDICEP